MYSATTKVNKPLAQQPPQHPRLHPPKIIQPFTGAQPVFMVPPGTSPTTCQYHFIYTTTTAVCTNAALPRGNHQAAATDLQQQQSIYNNTNSSCNHKRHPYLLSRTVSPPREEVVRTAASDPSLSQKPYARPPSTRTSIVQSPVKPSAISRPSSTISLAPPNQTIVKPIASDVSLATMVCKNQSILEEVDEVGDDLIQFAIQLAFHRIKTAPLGHQTPDALTFADMLLAIKLRGYDISRYEIEHVAHLKILTPLPDPPNTFVKRSNTGPHMARMSQLKRHLASLSVPKRVPLHRNETWSLGFIYTTACYWDTWGRQAANCFGSIVILLVWLCVL